MDVTDASAWLSTGDLAVPVRRLLGDGAVVQTWTSRRLTGGTSDALGVWRVSGDAITGGQVLSWSLILKGWRVPPAGVSPSSMNWPLREAALYRSGLLNDLPDGLAAPAYFGDEERSDGSTWLWTEDVQDSAPDAWPLELFASQARLLGQMNGEWITGRPLPELPDLSRGWVRERVEAAAPYIQMFRQVAEQPLVRQVYPPEVMDAYLRMWAERERWHAVLDRLPQTFCHMDASRRNTFTRIGPDKRGQTVLIDWAFAGIGALAEEMTSPIVASVMFGDAAVDDARQMEAAALDGYIEGLRDAGWRGDSCDVWHGYAVAAILRFGVGGVGRIMPVLLDEQSHPFVEQLFGFLIDEVFATLAAVQRWMVILIPRS
jgi:hypothetical protein